MPKLIQTAKEARSNVLTFFNDPDGYGRQLWAQPSYVKGWYAVRTRDGWAFGPSRIIGYEREDLQDYLNHIEERNDAGDFVDGRQTERALQKISERIPGEDPRFNQIMNSLKDWLRNHDAEPNALARLNFMGEDLRSRTRPRKRSIQELLRERLINEGQVEERLVRSRYRDVTVREECIRAHSCICEVCKIEFGRIFGAEFSGLIEVHHKTPIANGDSDGVLINPVEDCVPLCPNCHSMAHFGMPAGKCRSIPELKTIMRKAQR